MRYISLSLIDQSAESLFTEYKYVRDLQLGRPYIQIPLKRIQTLQQTEMNTFTHVPPGFRFHPTDEELVDYYLRKKVASRRIDLDVIKDVDLYKIEPWDLQELCKLGTDDQNDWYFFSHKDKKYPTGTRTNRATKAGFWKATGRDKAIYLKHSLVGMRKTLVFYKGRAPNGQKSDWIMHEYRLETNENGPPQEEGWVVCRVFKKRMATTMRRVGDDSPCWYDDQMPFMHDHLESPRLMHHHHHRHHPYNHLQYLQHQQQYPACKQELEQYHLHNTNNINAPFLQLPQLESPKVPQQQQQESINNTPHLFDHSMEHNSFYTNTNGPDGAVSEDQVTDWRVLDKFVASQFGQAGEHEDGGNKLDQTSILDYSPADHHINVVAAASSMFNIGETTVNLVIDHQQGGHDLSSTSKQDVGSSSNSGCPMDLWK